MKPPRRKTGRTVLLIVVIVLLASALGVLAWQQFSAKDTRGTTPSETPTTTQDQPPQKPENVLALSQWGLEIPLGENKAQYEAFAANSGDVLDYGITLKNLSSIKGCNTAEAGPGVLGHLTIIIKGYAETMDIKYDATATVDGKEYGWQAEPTVENCATSKQDKQAIAAARDDMTKLVKNLRRVQN